MTSFIANISNFAYKQVESAEQKKKRLDAIDVLQKVELLAKIAMVASGCLCLVCTFFSPFGLIGTVLFGAISVLGNDFRVSAKSTYDYLENIGAKRLEKVCCGTSDEDTIKELIKDTLILKRVWLYLS